MRYPLRAEGFRGNGMHGTAISQIELRVKVQWRDGYIELTTQLGQSPLFSDFGGPQTGAAANIAPIDSIRRIYRCLGHQSL